mgnify:CR=1 FL=1
MFEAISQAVQFTDNLIKTYPTVFHALVPIGTIATAVLGIKNTNHIKTQANIQREIESNRFNIELFENRVNIYRELKNNIKGNVLFKIEDIENIDNNIYWSIISDNKYIKRSLFVFNEDDNIPLNKCLIENEKIKMILVSIDSLQRRREYIDSEIELINDGKLPYLNPNSTLRSFLKEKMEIERYLNIHKEEISFLDYSYFCHKAFEYMEDKLYVPKQAFQEKTSLMKRAWRSLSKSEQVVIFGIGGICALTLWCALIFEVASRY